MMHSSVYTALKTRRKQRSRLEYHVFARFPCNASGVRIAVVLSERTARAIGGWAAEYASEVSYRIKPRDPKTKHYSKPRRFR